MIDRRPPIIVPDDQIDDYELIPYPFSQQIVDLIDDLYERCAAVEGVEAANKWRRSITGISMSEGRVSGVNIDGVRDADHWLVSWLQARLVHEWPPVLISENGLAVRFLRPRQDRPTPKPKHDGPAEVRQLRKRDSVGLTWEPRPKRTT